MSSLAASGGYYIAMDADRIIASPATLTGSIGIFAMIPTFQRTLERIGVHVDGVGTTALSGEFRLAAGKTPVTQLSLAAPPKGEERWIVGSPSVIRWTFTGKPGPTVKLALIQKQTGDVIPITGSASIGVDGKGAYEWKVPALKPGNDYFVGIASNSNAFYQDMGAAPVSISATR